MSTPASRHSLRAVALLIVTVLATANWAQARAVLQVGYGGAHSLGVPEADLAHIEEQFIAGLSRLQELSFACDDQTRARLGQVRDGALSGDPQDLDRLAVDFGLDAAVYLSGCRGPGGESGGWVKAVVIHNNGAVRAVLPTAPFRISDPEAAMGLVAQVCALLPPLGMVAGIIKTGDDVGVQVYFTERVRERVTAGARYHLHQPLPLGEVAVLTDGGKRALLDLTLPGRGMGIIEVTDSGPNGWMTARPIEATQVPALGTLVMAAPAGEGAFGGRVKGTIVLSSPAEAICEMDGQPVGLTPLLVTQEPPDGDYGLKLLCDGYEELAVGLTPSAGLSWYRAALTRIPPFGSLRVSTVPEGARVTLDGIPRGISPLVLQQLPAGEHRLRVSLVEHHEYETTLTIKVREETEVEVALVRSAQPVTIISQPPGATVSLGGRLLGQTPLTGVSVPVGEQVLEVKLDGHQPASIQMQVDATAAPAPVTLRLSPLPGSLVLSSTPVGAAVELDGQTVGNTPLTLDKVPAGTHRLRLVKSGYHATDEEITIAPGGALQHTVALQRQTGLLSIVTLPDGADVLLAGARIGRTPLERYELPVGEHHVVLRKAGYQSWGHSVTVLADELTEVSVALVEGEDQAKPAPTVGETPDEPSLTVTLTHAASGTSANLRVTTTYTPSAGYAVCSLELSADFPADTRTVATDELVAVVIPGFLAGEERQSLEIPTGPVSAVQAGRQSAQQQNLRVQLTLLCRAQVEYRFVNSRRFEVIIRPLQANGYSHTSKRLALTFDDFPFANSDQLLDCLQELGVTATLFAIGNKVSQFQHLVRRAALVGHRIENHSYAHENLAMMNADELAADLRRCNAEIERVVGYAPELVRPPGGQLRSSQEAVLRSLGLTRCGWTVNTADYKYPNPDTIARAILDGAQPDAIVLLHDGIPATLQALRRVVPMLRERGYSFVSVQDLAEGPSVRVVRSP